MNYQQKETRSTTSIKSGERNGLLRNASTLVEGSTDWASPCLILNALIKITFISGCTSFSRLMSSNPDIPDIRMSDTTTEQSSEPSSIWLSAVIGRAKE